MTLVLLLVYCKHFNVRLLLEKCAKSIGNCSTWNNANKD